MSRVSKSISTKRVFLYQKKNISLNFELKEDLQHLKDFRSLLVEAKKDLDKFIEEVEK